MIVIKNFLKEADYNFGYQQAILDLGNYIESHRDSMKIFKLFNYAGIMALIKAVLRNQKTFREYAENTVFMVKEDDKQNKELVLGEQI